MKSNVFQKVAITKASAETPGQVKDQCSTNKATQQRPWRLSKEQVIKERKQTAMVLSRNNSESSFNVNGKAIIFCYEAEALLDSLPLPKKETSEYLVARSSVERFRQVATNDAGKEDIERARVDAVTSLKNLGLEKEMREALRVCPPGKWPVMHEIIKGVWCGGWAALQNECRALQEHNISSVVSVVSADKRHLPSSIVKEHLYVHAHDDGNANLLEHFPRIVSFVGESLRKGCNVYIHCGAGVSRAPTCTTAFIMARFKLPADESLKLVRKARPAARPNQNFVEQLRDWEIQLGIGMKMRSDEVM